MKIYIGYDHRCLKMAYKLMEELVSAGHEVNEPFEANTPDDDYPDISTAVCKKVKKDKNAIGILLCGTGIGMYMAANRELGIRAAIAKDEADAYFARRHENCNVLVMAAGYDDGVFAVKPTKNVMKIVERFISTPFEGGRHIRRVKKQEEILKSQF